MIVKNLSKSFNSNKILDNISFVLEDNDKVCLIGNNGAGKSTLLKILNGDIKYDSGNINYNDESIGMLMQEIDIEDYDLTITCYIKRKTGFENIENKLKELEENLNDSNMEEYGNVLDLYLKLDGYNFENNINMLLNGLGLNKDLNKKVKELSGGEKIKVLLTILLLSNPDIMLLDEPTNNLDIDGITYLENYLVKLNKKMIIVSHDEEFLNNISNKIFELNQGKLTEYKMSYYEYLDYKKKEYKRNLEKYNSINEKKEELKSRIKEAEKWSNKGVNKKKKDNDKIAANFAKEQTKKTSGNISKLKRELEKLSKEEKMIIESRYMKDMTQTETAEALGMSQVQISRNEKKVLIKLRDRLQM